LRTIKDTYIEYIPWPNPVSFVWRHGGGVLERASDADPRDLPYTTGERSPEGYYKLKPGMQAAIARGVCYAPYADIIWCETSTPDIDEARRFAEGIHRAYPGKLLAYNCSPSFNWEKHLDPGKIRGFQEELASMGYKFQFVTLAGFHSLSVSMFDLAKHYAVEGMAAYVRVQRKEFEAEREGYTTVKHQSFVGTEYFDEIATVISNGTFSTSAMDESTETSQFSEQKAVVTPPVRRLDPDHDGSQ